MCEIAIRNIILDEVISIFPFIQYKIYDMVDSRYVVMVSAGGENQSGHWLWWRRGAAPVPPPDTAATWLQQLVSSVCSSNLR